MGGFVMKPIISTGAEIQRDWDFFHQIKDDNNWSENSRQKRLALLADFLGIEIPTLSSTSLKSEQMQGNIENFIGSVEIPVGLAGPLYFFGDHVHGPVLMPLATSEGALVASACRGAKLLNACGGVHTTHLGSQMTRAPAFTCRNADQAVRLGTWVEQHLNELKATIQEEHAQLLRVKPIIHGRSLSLEFFFTTGDAAGQNMSTIATGHCCEWILKHAAELDIEIMRHTIESGFSGDKKLSHLNFAEGRGSRVIAEAWIDEAEMQKIMRVSTQDCIRTFLSDVPNYFLNGSVACNSNTANIIAAVFTATGQDIACVHESSLGQICLEQDDKGMYVSLLMPCLVVGTVGGGTRLPSQTDALKMMGCQGTGTKERLAETIAGYCLALELSTMSAAIEGTFISAHSRLGRHH
jgi:hydroxymethylglutaryl-CoA reductase (NADPH)